MLAAGWHAHTLKAPGKFLISATEHDTPRRARAYLLTDQAVAETASRYADLQPPLDPVSAAVLGASSGHGPADPDDGQDGPDAKGWRGGRRGPADPETLLRDRPGCHGPAPKTMPTTRMAWAYSAEAAVWGRMWGSAQREGLASWTG